MHGCASMCNARFHKHETILRSASQCAPVSQCAPEVQTCCTALPEAGACKRPRNNHETAIRDEHETAVRDSCQRLAGMQPKARDGCQRLAVSKTVFPHNWHFLIAHAEVCANGLQNVISASELTMRSASDLTMRFLRQTSTLKK